MTVRIAQMILAPSLLSQVEVPKARWTIDNFPASTVQVGSPTVYQITPVGLTTRKVQVVGVCVAIGADSFTIDHSAEAIWSIPVVNSYSEYQGTLQAEHG